MNEKVRGRVFTSPQPGPLYRGRFKRLGFTVFCTHGQNSQLLDSGVRDTSWTLYGFNFEGTMHISTDVHEYEVPAQHYFSLPRGQLVRSGNGVLLSVDGYAGMGMVGGPVEAIGRLQYINGCTDSLLLPPPRKGDPCLNALFFPPMIQQDWHFHPSHRVGWVVGGEGRYFGAGGEHSMKSGDIFVTEPSEEHRFETSSEQPMVLVIFHPDSLDGPTDDVHVMKTGTIRVGQRN